MRTMGVNFKKRQLLQTIVTKECPNCNHKFDAEDVYCRNCGTELTSQTIKVYANIGKSGITSYSYVLPGGQTINSKGMLTFNIGSGISFTQKL